MILTLGVLALLDSGCINSYCRRDADCTGGLICQQNTGACVEPECTTEAECGPGQLCADRRCRDACPECNLPVAPAFCGTDINPSSRTAEARLCVPDSFPDGVALFFGNVGCGHCTAIYDALKLRMAQLQAEGFAPKLVWVQIASLPATPSDVFARLGAEGTVPVILDTPDLGVWSAYAAEWYEVILINGHGCLTQSFKSLSGTLIAGETGDQIVAAWREAMGEECPAPPDGGDAGTDAGDGGDADAADDSAGERDDAIDETVDVAEAIDDATEVVEDKSEVVEDATEVVEDIPDAGDGAAESSTDGT
jgi:hypothetical protein